MNYESVKDCHVMVGMLKDVKNYLGVSSAWHIFSPWTIASEVSLVRGEGIWSRPTESGSRWQTAGEICGR